MYIEDLYSIIIGIFSSFQSPLLSPKLDYSTSFEYHLISIKWDIKSLIEMKIKLSNYQKQQK